MPWMSAKGDGITVAGHVMVREPRLHLDVREQSILAPLCLCAGVAPLAARWIPGDVPRVTYGLVAAAAYLAFALLARNSPPLRRYWELSFAFFILAFAQVLNNAVPGFVGTDILHDPPKPGNPLASTVPGTIVVQLVGTAVAIVPVIAFAMVSGTGLGSIYARVGRRGGWLVFAIAFFFAFYVFLARIALRPDSPAQRLLPTNGTITLDRLLALTPALLVLVISNGFEEEFLFRGLFLQRYDAFFDARLSNVLQAIIFSTAHVGVTYTPAALLFIVAVVFPLGLVTGFLMRATSGVIAPVIFHAGLDMAIYLPFLSFVA